MSRRIQYSAVEELRTRWSDEGEGVPVVLVHGGGQGYSLNVWTEVSTALSDRGWRVVSVDLPGYGETEPPDPSRGLSTAGFLASVIRDICGGRAHLVGHSVNGNHVVRVALESPELLHSAATVGTGRLLPGFANRPGGPGDGQSRGERSEAQQAPNLDDVRRNLSRDVVDPKVLTDERVSSVLAMIEVTAPHAAAVRQAGRVDRTLDDEREPLWTRLKHLKVPFLAVFGGRDKNGAGTLAPRLREECPGVRVEVIENSAHLVQWDAPLVLSNLLDSFYRSVT